MESDREVGGRKYEVGSISTSYLLPHTSYLNNSSYLKKRLKGVFIVLVLSRVCAEFHDHTGAVVHRVTPETRLTFREAPESIREDPLFQLLVNEGSLEAAVSPAQKKQLEADPLEGSDAAGRKRGSARKTADGAPA